MESRAPEFREYLVGLSCTVKALRLRGTMMGTLGIERALDGLFSSSVRDKIFNIYCKWEGNNLSTRRRPVYEVKCVATSNYIVAVKTQR